MPTLLADVTPGMRVAREKIFGPVAPIFRFSSEQDVIAQANDTEFGLACYLYARDVGRIWRVSEALEYGMVGVNVRVVATVPASRFYPRNGRRRRCKVMSARW
ncbi:succinate-semialdehyde dehydrogenase/glutarate-semialdehyde dehydrogenase [Pseudomonas sp. OG7]|uniref:aldehyde dehydrogenase family protein n=1 Tax=Pseudomonas sp. OG7 TaxID=2587037 RepID=UPI0009D7EC1B|nr:succinate-semialdehyde dehydrogenase/glutarate-semialdehyde dehydrogenase [Pseudomonas sp. OG7]SMC58498.1 NAD-dependent aldehyde dehydrogenases [Pseudomonas sp. URIL14HWK12:I5]